MVRSRVNPMEPADWLRLRGVHAFPKWLNLGSKAAARSAESRVSVALNDCSAADARTGYDPLSRNLQRSFIDFAGMHFPSFLTTLSGSGAIIWPKCFGSFTRWCSAPQLTRSEYLYLAACLVGCVRDLASTSHPCLLLAFAESAQDRSVMVGGSATGGDDTILPATPAMAA